MTETWVVSPDAPPVILPLADLAAACGFPSPAQDYRTSEIDLNEFLFTNRHASFIMRAQGHSMVRAGIFDGDELIVDRSIEPLDGHVVVAVIDGEMLVKRLRIRADRSVLLEAENPDYPTIPMAEMSELKVWGVVVRSLHRVTRT